MAGGKLYWTQKGPDNGGKGSIRGASLEPRPGEDSAHRSDIEANLEGSVGRAHLDGSSPATLFKNQGSLTGITLVELPK